MKPVRWLGTARSDIRAFPDPARKRAGYQLSLVQLGLEPDDWKPMPSIGSGVAEIRVHTEIEHRVFYVAKYSEAIYVLHAFTKRTRKTAVRDIQLARKRLEEVQRWRRDDAQRVHEGGPP